MLTEEKASGVTKLIPRCKAGNTTRDKEDYFMIKRSQHIRKEHQLYTCRHLITKKENTQSNSIPRSGAVGTGPDNTTLSSRHLTEAADSKPARSSDCREL